VKLRERKLATVAAFMIVAIAVTVWMIVRARTASEQADRLAAMTSEGASIIMDYEEEGRPPSTAPLWLRGIRGDLPFAHAVKVAVTDCDQLRDVGQFQRLRELDLEPCATILTDELKYLQDCRRLQVLRLPHADSNGDALTLECIRDLPELRVLDLSEAMLSAEQLSCFKFVPQLCVLRLAKVSLGDEGLRRLRFLKQLEELDLRETGVVGPGLTALKGMTSLRTLDLHGTAVGGADLANLKDLTLLEDLDLSETHVQDEDMASLAGLTNLTRLNLMETDVRGPGLRRLRGLKRLSVRIVLNGDDLENLDGTPSIAALQLNLHKLSTDCLDQFSLHPEIADLYLKGSYFDDESPIDDERIENVAKLTRLRKLDLFNVHISDAGMSRLANLTELKELSLGFSAIQGSGLAVLSKLPRLEVLTLANLSLCDDDLKHLGPLTQLRELTVNGNSLTDAALGHLAGLKQLRTISIRSTRITTKGVQKLRASLPDCKFEFNGEEQ
jgi:internalin A